MISPISLLADGQRATHQRFSLIELRCCQEEEAQVVSDVRDRGVIGAETLLRKSQCPSEQRLGLRRSVTLPQ